MTRTFIFGHRSEKRGPEKLGEVLFNFFME